MIPKQIDRYEIRGSLGRGGMGKVYRAYDPHLNREVVLKFINVFDPDLSDEWRQRFKREVQVAGSLNHPHIVTVYDVVLDHDPPYVVMELLTGGTLKQRLKSGPLPWREALILLKPLAEALAYAHRTGVVHRDVKPDNVMFTDDETNTIKLVDFGLARWQRSDGLTQPDAVMGTPAYMSPEQARGEVVDERTDIFAFGVILFEAIVGHNPLYKDSPISTMVEVTSSTKIDLSPLIKVASPAVVKLVAHAVAKKREQRYPTCEGLLVDLAGCLGEQLEISPDALVDSQPVGQFDDKPEKPTLTLPPNRREPIVEIEPPFGTMPPDSKLYIERAVDGYCREQLGAGRAVTLFIQAPRQMGKSSLMRRVLAQASQTYSKPFVFIDFQRFPEHYFRLEEDFLIEFCSMMSEELGVPEAIDQYWEGRRANIMKCSRYVSEHIIPHCASPLILAMDEVERMLTSSFQSDFFGMLRTWHNNRAYDENFAKLTLFLSSSTEPYLFIDNPNQSPFNVAEVFTLQDFTRDEVDELNRRHRSPLNPQQVSELMDLVEGHPFLTRLALYLVATGKIDADTLFVQATEDTGPFGDHLRHYLLRVLQRPDLKQALTDICRTHTYEENQVFHRLKGSGLVKKVGQQVVLRNRLYTRYFEERFNV